MAPLPRSRSGAAERVQDHARGVPLPVPVPARNLDEQHERRHRRRLPQVPRAERERERHHRQPRQHPPSGADLRSDSTRFMTPGGARGTSRCALAGAVVP